jgi:hypothetical protein
MEFISFEIHVSIRKSIHLASVLASSADIGSNIGMYSVVVAAMNRQV